jgi:hypothetical protein
MLLNSDNPSKTIIRTPIFGYFFQLKKYLATRNIHVPDIPTAAGIIPIIGNGRYRIEIMKVIQNILDMLYVEFTGDSKAKKSTKILPPKCERLICRNPLISGFIVMISLKLSPKIDICILNMIENSIQKRITNPVVFADLFKLDFMFFVFSYL